MSTTEIFQKSYSERLLKIAKNVKPKKDYSIMEIITWFKEQPKKDKPYWVFILIAFVYFAVQVAIGMWNY